MAGAIISGLDGRLGMPGWQVLRSVIGAVLTLSRRWLFLIEGILTVAFAGIFLFVLIDYPNNTRRFFSAEERQLAYVRILHDRQTSVVQHKKKLTSLQSVWAVLADPRSWAFLVLYIMNSTSTSISYFVPVTLRTMGYTAVTAQWMTVPIWISGAIIMVILSTSSDYFRDRRWHTAVALGIAFICSCVCLTTTAGIIRYAMLCFYIGGLYTAIAQILNWTSEEMALPDQKRSVALAFINSWGNLSIIWGSRLWPSAQSPGYRLGFSTVAAMTGVGTIMAIVMPFGFRMLPKTPMTRAERELMAEDGAEETPPRDRTV